MKRILTTLACLLMATVAGAASFQAVAGGSWHATNTWGGVTIPGASDNVDLNGQAVTMTGTVSCASLVDVATGGSLDFGENASFTCRDVTDAPLTTSAAGVTVDVDYTLTTGDGFTINSGGEATIAGEWNNSGGGTAVNNNGGTVIDFSGSIVNSGSGYGVYNNGTWTDFSGTLTSSGTGGTGVCNANQWFDFSGTLTFSDGGSSAAENSGTWYQFSGTLNNTGNATGAFNIGGTWSDFSGTLNNVGAYGYGASNNYGLWSDFSGTLNNTGAGYGAENYSGTWSDFSGTIYLGKVGGQAVGGEVISISGSIEIVAQPDLAAGNILIGKTILSTAGSFNESARNTDPGTTNVLSGVSYKISNASKTGTLTAGGSGYGINGTGLLGAGW